MVHVLSLAALLSTVWLLLSGMFYPLFLVLGAASIAVVIWLSARMDVADHEGVPVSLGWRTLVYWPWLLKKIALSNIDVARRVLSPSLPVSPVSFEVKALQRTPLGRTIFANSLTLTPGTVSMSIDGETILVHALTEEGRDEVLAGEMNRKACWFEGDVAGDESRREGAAPTRLGE
ncbi:MAG: Na+/H+ antiporter subunit E [Gammaproteobacteria bacterium]